MFRERPLLVPFLALAAGLAVTDLGNIILPFSAVLLAACSLLLSSFIRYRLPFAACAFAFFFVWGMYALTPWKNPTRPPWAIERHAAPTPVTIEGVVQSRPVATPGDTRFIMRVDSVFRKTDAVPACGRLMIHVSKGDVTIARGDRVRFATRIVLPRRLGLPGEFDYTRYLAYQGIAAIGRADSMDDIVLMRAAAEDSLLRRIDLLARRLGDFIRASVPDENVSSVLTALLLGDMKRIPQPLNEAYTRAGVNHILSISGFHVGIIAYFIVMVVLFCATRSEILALRFNLRRTVLLLSLPAMVFYLLLTGAAPATARSVIMLAFFVIALYAERETDPVNALLSSALLLTAVNPPTLFDLSFQLSFIALWGITVAVPPVLDRFKGMERAWIRSVAQFLAASCAASLATVVPVLFYFNQASLNGIVSNFLIVPLLGYGAVLTGFCALPFVYIFTPMAHLLLRIAGKLTALSNWLISMFSELPLLSFHGITYLDMLAFLVFMSVLTFIQRRRLKSFLCLVLPSAAVIAHLAVPSPADGRLHVTMLSVGQGESLLIRTPDGAVMLVDGGGYLHDNGRDFGERILAPALHKMGVNRIDSLVLTHSHPDHLGGLPYIAGMFPVGEFWEAAPGGSGEGYDNLREILDKRGIPVRRLSAGSTLTPCSGVVLTVLWPPPGQLQSRQTNDIIGMNDNSLVFRLTYGNFSMLFTADTGFAAEERILANRTELASTVLKIGHHGSRFSTSAAFLDRVAPKAALVSAGSGNSFGLPSGRTLSLLESRGIRTYRTDRDGTIELVSDGGNWNITTPFQL